MIVEADTSNMSSSSGEDGSSSKSGACGGVSAIKRADEEEMEEVSTNVQQREKEDRARLNSVRTLFYQLNERFEQLLKYKPISQVNVWEAEMNLEAAHLMLSAFSVSERPESLTDQVKDLELQLDLKEYHDIKRPTVVFFTHSAKTLSVCRFDLLCEKGNGAGFHEGSISPVKAPKIDAVGEWRALTHPSNNSVFLIQGGISIERPLTLYLFDNQNEVLLGKPSCPHQMGMGLVSRQAVAYNEGFIYLMGGFDARQGKIVKACARYNIVTEKWQQLTSMLFEISEGAACAINEYQVVVAGGVNSNRMNSDIVQLYDVRENQWRLFEVCLSTPRRQITMVSSQKDRVMILGGREADGAESRTVEEIDFIKRNLVSLPPFKHGRASPSAF